MTGLARDVEEEGGRTDGFLEADAGEAVRLDSDADALGCEEGEIN